MLLVPEYQGRVMTSSAGGSIGNSFGWINYDLIKSEEVNTQFNLFGGEVAFGSDQRVKKLLFKI
jgi:hypothetical protein